jgi:hypothetical protein
MARSLALCTLVAASLLGLFAASSAEATPIGPACGTCQGSIYDLTYSGSPIASTATTETFRITYTIDTTGYNGTGAYLDAVALKVASSFVDANLVSAPNGVAAWTELFGGLANAGCTGSGSGFDCVMVTANVDLLLVPNATYTWEFDIEVATGSLFDGLDEASVKARYVNFNGTVRQKAGALVSENITLSVVPEPAAALLLGAGALCALARRRR